MKTVAPLLFPCPRRIFRPGGDSLGGWVSNTDKTGVASSPNHNLPREKRMGIRPGLWAGLIHPEKTGGFGPTKRHERVGKWAVELIRRLKNRTGLGWGGLEKIGKYFGWEENLSRISFESLSSIFLIIGKLSRKIFLAIRVAVWTCPW